MKNAKCLITDNSGISIEYMMLFKKPVIFYSDFDKVHNESFEMFKNLNTIEDTIKEKFGYEFNKHELIEIDKVINKAISILIKKKLIIS